MGSSGIYNEAAALVKEHSLKIVFDGMTDVEILERLNSEKILMESALEDIHAVLEKHGDKLLAATLVPEIPASTHQPDYYAEGVDAFNSNKTSADCSYTYGSEAGMEWMKGYRDSGGVQ